MFSEETTTIEYDADGALRLNALAFALSHHGQLNSGSADDVIETAQKFFDFLGA